MKALMQLTYMEQRVISMFELKYAVEEVALILGISVRAVEFYRSQARQKMHIVYAELC